jgi:hypothetical protein
MHVMDEEEQGTHARCYAKTRSIQKAITLICRDFGLCRVLPKDKGNPMSTRKLITQQPGKLKQI